MTLRPSYCSVFGPEVYSEPFSATTAQALSFDWGAQGVEDNYEIYAFLVRVDDATRAIPTKAEALAATGPTEVGYHTLLEYGRGQGPSNAANVVFRTSSGAIPSDGYYRFRFVNGTYDGTGGTALGATMNIDPNIVVGLVNAITFNPLDDLVSAQLPAAAVPLVVSATSGQPVTVTSLTTNICTVALNGAIWEVTAVGYGTCTLSASQGPTGNFAAASTEFQDFQVLAAAAVPAAPTITALTPTETTVDVTFIAGGNGGSPITGYEYTLDGTTWIPVPGGVTTSPLTISGLTPGTEYDIRIRAVNAIGPGAQSNEVGVTTSGGGPVPVFPPSEPLNVVATGGDRSANITWRTPASEGSFPITNYRVIAEPGGASCLVPVAELTCTITGLTNGVTYTFRVQALNGAGWGPYSAASNAITPGPDDTPTIVITGTRTGDRLNVRGVTTNIPAGTRFTPNVSLNGGPFEAGQNIRPLGEDERFTWTRRVQTGRDAAVFFSDGEITSNTLQFPVTPTIVITGTRSGERVVVDGVTTNISPDTRLTPMISFNGGPVSSGKNIRRVGSDQEFTWKRRVKEANVLTVYFTNGTVDSNSLTLQP